MSLEEKKAALQKSKTYHAENSDFIKFDPNIPKTVIFPANWHEMISYRDKEFDDKKNPGQKKIVTYTVYKVYNPNSQDTKRLRTLEASGGLSEEISTFLDLAIEQAYDGASIAKITKVQKGSSEYARWTVQGDRISNEQLKELKIIE